ncbi:hypothetical protein GC088_14265 [Arthrobacter sp. JZ12]|uniref:hypothetical protein n=1 Tax=Arthrobacter sp. JZ12 TaxID=2654190 RepID=UPI002B465697|nr:hypothetical protein [Arthrobacter sp. JZ12]WRH26117.1 hypothetical protein GC088_14265 [Arthrobacter sp. JZ12]
MPRANSRNDASGSDVTAMFVWPRPLSPQALKAIKTLLLGALVIIALVQIVPFQVLGGMANHLFTVLLILSWVGPARRMFRRRTEDRNPGEHERNEGSAPDEK